MIYLDNAATTFPKPEIIYDEMDRVNRTLAVNAGRGTYRAAQEALHIIEDTKHMLSKLFFADGVADVIFTPSVTHAFYQIINGISLNENSVVYISPYEHNAVARNLELLKNSIGFSVELLPNDPDGKINLEETNFNFSLKKPDLVICSGVSNVTGYILPYNEIFSLAKKSNNSCITLIDAAQAAGLIEIDIIKDNIDILAFAGHKTLQGPFGIAGFLIRKEIELSTVFAGGTGSDSLNLNMPKDAPFRYEASSPNIIAIAGLRAALKCLDINEHFVTVKSLTNYLLEQLSFVKKVKLCGIVNNNIGIVSFVVDGYYSQDVGAILDEEFDIAVRTGYHCAPYIHSILNDISHAGTVRVGIGNFNERKDIDALIAALKSL